jgi:predicted SnoaL-like aldol condensation-catalyzing enzyme
MKKKKLRTTVAATLGIFTALSMSACANAATQTHDKKHEEVRSAEKSKKISNADKAVAVLESLESGDSKAIKRYINPNKYIQHNLTFPEGRQIMLDSLDQLKKSGTKVEVKRVLTDGNLVAIHSEYNFNGPKAGFDIFRFEKGKIVEHWDNLQQLVEKTPSGHTMLDGSTKIIDLNKTEKNKKLVKNFVQDVLMGQHPDKLTSYFNDDNYIQHNPNIADGLTGLNEALKAMADKGVEMKYDKIHMVIGQGNFVLVASEGTFGEKHTSYYDLFRVEKGKIAEHWDVIETILPQDQWKNQNGKF